MSNHHHTLESEKYFMTSLEFDKEMAREKARADAEQAITNMIIVILAVAAGFYAVKSMPVWLPIAQTTFHQLTNYKFV